MAQNVSDEVYHQIVCNYLKSINYSSARKYKVLKQECKSQSDGANSGFLGAGSLIQISLELDTGVSDLKMFAKRPPKGNVYHENIVTYMDTFSRESQAYNKILPKIEQFLDEPVFPKCYYADENLVVLEDLCSAGFKSIPDSNLYSLERCQLVLNALAKYHASAVIFEHETNTKIDQVYPGIHNEAVYVKDEDHPCFKWISAGSITFKHIFDKCFSYFPDVVREKGIWYMDNIIDNVNNLKSTYRMLTHCDVWNNNIMFCDSDSKPLAVRLIDFQLVRYCSPSFDIVQFLYLTTSPGFRAQYFSSLTKFYYNIFSSQLQKFGIDSNSVISYDQLVQDIEDFKLTGMALCLCYMHFVFLPKDILLPHIKSADKYKHLIENERSQLVFEVMQNDAEYRRRVTHAVLEFLEHVHESLNKL